MKYLMFLLAVFAALTTKAQTGSFSNTTIVPSYNLEITTSKTTLLIFPAAIQGADRGDSYVLAEKVKGVDNVLKVKAAQKNFDTSNLHVITSDGKVYGFNVSYSDNPPYQTLDLRKQPPFAPVEFRNVSLNSVQLTDCGNAVAGSDPFLHGVHSHEHGMTFTLDGIYIKDDVLFFRFWLHNKTAIPYEAGSLRFYIRDKKKIKRTAEQDKETEPIYTQHSGVPEQDKGEIIVVAFPKFTIAENKDFVCEMTEQGGDRNPSVKLSQDKLLQAKPLYK